MTLPELAALAAKVKGFVRPTCDCFECDEGTVVDQFGDDAKACRSCNGAGFKPDNSPAALLMAVMAFAAANRRSVHFQYDGWVNFGVSAPARFTADLESIARAALVALLRAHGVEVQDA